MTFRVGQKVVCVDASGCVPDAIQLTVNSVYTIRHIRNGKGRDGKDGEGVTLNEVVNPLARSGREWAYCITRFRPLVETDISFAHEIVRKVFDGVRA